MILFVTRIPPNDDGPGGAQRAMHLLRAVLRHGPVDLLVLHRSEDREAADDTLDAVRPLVRSCLKWEVPEWAPSYQRWPVLPWRLGQMVEPLAIHSIDAPRFSRRTLERIADLLPQRRYDLIFAARLSSACIVDALIDRRLLAATRKVVDLDDMISRFKLGALTVAGAREGRLRRSLQRLDIGRLRRAETRLARRWDAVGIASRDDAAAFARDTGGAVWTLPNVIDREPLPAPVHSNIRVLFVGHLAYAPNIDGLTRFLEEAWPLIRERLPRATFDVVGMFPSAELTSRIERAGAQLHADVPSVEPFYLGCDIVIAPILFGSGTRIKIIEAMALGRPVVTTTMGAEGLGVTAGRDVVIADTMPAFADAVVALADDPTLRGLLVANARALQQDRYSASALDRQVDTMIEGKEPPPAHDMLHAHPFELTT